MYPNTLIVRNIAAILIAGPEKRNVIAGPSPAPLFLIPANNGRIVQLQTASIAPKETGKIRNPSEKVQRGKVRNKEVVEDPEGILEIDVNDEQMKVNHQYVQNIEGEALRAWEVRSDGIFLVKTNIGPLLDLTGKEYPTFALHNICESLAEYCLDTKDTGTIIQVRYELIKKVYCLIYRNHLTRSARHSSI